MGFEGAPPDLKVVATTRGATIGIDPYLTDFGKRDLVQIIAAVTTASVIYRIGALLGPDLWLVLFSLAIGIVLFGCGWVTLQSWRRARKQRTQLEMTLSDTELHLRWRLDGQITSEECVSLNQIGRVDVQEAGYQRPHVVANVFGREALVIPVERHSTQAATWLAQTISASAKRARDAR